MAEPATISFVATKELKRLLENWAKDEDRTVSATLRRILENEAKRRKQTKSPQAMSQLTQ